ncbi:FKBP-type peptidyl-prolyl cis-trans isomerase [Sinomicrobium sp.]
MMKINRLGLAVVGTLTLLYSCKKDDDGGRIEVRDPVEVEAENDSDIRDYLSTHFYNYEEFEAAASGELEDFDYKIVIDSIGGENSDKIPLIDQVKDTVIPIEIGEDEPLDHKMYYLVARQGDQEAPEKTDSALVRYKGFRLNDAVFDRSNVPVWFDLNNVVQGFSEFMPYLKSGGEIIVDEEDGTYLYSGNYGVGLVFMPAALGYYTGQGSIPSYSPIAFSIELFRVREGEAEE